ncbi:MAG: hypothetical protein ACRD2E_13805 [Terriglobales bacterium]
MVRTDLLVTPQAVTAEAMAAAEDWLVRAGWRSAARAAAEGFSAAMPEGGAPPLRSASTASGGIFFAPGTGAPAEWFYAIAKNAAPRIEPELEIGLIRPDGPPGPKPLATWSAGWSAALVAVGTVAGEVAPTWRDPLRPARLAPLAASGAYVRPRLRLADLDRSALLADPESRAWLERLQQAGQLRGAELDTESAEARAALERLAAARLAVAPSQEADVYIPSAQAARCGQQWPQHWLTERLSELGCGHVLWPRELTPAMPPHVVAEFAGRLWCLVCTPGAWDRPARRAWEEARDRWGWEQTGVIALAGAAAAPPAVAPVLISLEAGAGALRRALGGAALAYAAHRLAPLEEAYGWPLAALLKRRFGEAAHAAASP